MKIINPVLVLLVCVCVCVCITPTHLYSSKVFVIASFGSCLVVCLDLVAAERDGVVGEVRKL